MARPLPKMEQSQLLKNIRPSSDAPWAERCTGSARKYRRLQGVEREAAKEPGAPEGIEPDLVRLFFVYVDSRTFPS
jgi:hypothetical protein